MNHAKTSGRFAIFFCLFTFLMNAQSSDKPIFDRQDQIALSQEEQVVCEQIFTILVTKIYPTLSMLCEQIALITNNNQLRITNKKEVVEKIVEYRTFFNAVLSGQAMAPTPENLYLLILLAEQAVINLRKAIATSLQEFQILDPQKIMAKKATRGSTPSAQSLHKATVTLLAQTRRLNRQANEVGLSWVNKTFRNLEKLNNRYGILSKAAWTAGIGAGAFLLFFMLDPDFFNKLFNKGAAGTSGNATPKIAPTDLVTLTNNGKDLTLPAEKAVEIGADLEKQGWTLKNPILPTPAPGQSLTPTTPSKTSSGTSWYDRMADGLIYYKEQIGGPADPKTGLHLIENPTIFTRLHHFSRNFVDWSVPKIAVGTWIGYKIGSSWDTISTWVSNKMTQAASYLRGTPVQKVAEGIYVKEPKVTMDDIIGNEHNKAELELLYNYLVDYENFDRAGLIPETGYLFSGPPRTGKTHMAEAFAGSVQRALTAKGSIEQLRFITLTPAAFKSLGAEPGESRIQGIKNVLIGARDYAPVVIFIDEFDLGGWQRERDTDALGELLDAMSTLNKDKVRKVVVIAATNSPNTIDIALRSPGRFGKTLFFKAPSMEERFEFLHRELTTRAVLVTEEFAQFLLQIARETEGASYDALSRLVIVALLRAKMRQSSLEPIDLEMALDQVIRQIQPALLETMSQEEQKIIAAHLAGHILASSVLKARDIVIKATICPISPKVKEEMILAKYEKKKEEKAGSSNIDKGPAFRYGAIFSLRSEQDTIPSYQDLTMQAKVRLAGHSAETILRGSCAYTYHPKDEAKAFQSALQITLAGFKPEQMTKQMYQQKLADAHALVENWKQEVMFLLEQHKEELELLSLALFNHKIVHAGIINAIMKDPKNAELRSFISKTQEELIEEIMKAQEAASTGTSSTPSDAASIVVEPQQDDSPETSVSDEDVSALVTSNEERVDVVTEEIATPAQA